MRPRLRIAKSRPETPILRSRLAGICGFAVLLTIIPIAGCSGTSGLNTSLPQTMAEIRCLSDCRAVKDQCQADARFDFRQCQADYSRTFRDYRWCLASAFERSDCGYPWWSCAENLYGYCANRAAECETACRSASSRSRHQPATAPMM
jgi:hypothetical protein